MFNRSGKSGHPYLVPNVRGKEFCFSPWNMMLAMGLWYMAFIMLRFILSALTLLKVFIINSCLILSNIFSASIETIMWFLSFILLVLCTTLIDLQMLRHSCISRISPTWSWHLVLLMYCWFDLVIFCWGILHFYSLVILDSNFFFLVVSFSCFGIR